jgi:phosphoenolpyruvate synthase/pyruvate phosphate dikinase
MTSPIVVWLDSPESIDPAIAGNKAATLATLRQLGYCVPDGFCIAASALDNRPADWRGPVRDALDHLMPPWVVRSSATVEDSRTHGFPGLFVTVLDVSDVRSAFEAIASVRSSSTTKSVLSYARHHGIDLSHMHMAILVQTLVPATVAGVAFSQDPVTGAPGVVIEANYGLGETVVDGSVTPDSVTVSGGELVDRRIGSKRQKVVATTHGTRLRRLQTSELERSTSSLADDAARLIATTVLQIENDLTIPVDVEWALAADRLYILQARPITTNSQEPARPS